MKKMEEPRLIERVPVDKCTGPAACLLESAALMANNLDIDTKEHCLMLVAYFSDGSMRAMIEPELHTDPGALIDMLSTVAEWGSQVLDRVETLVVAGATSSKGEVIH